MANQNRATYQATIDSVITSNGTGGISASTDRPVRKNLSDSVHHVNTTITALGTNPTTWDLSSYDGGTATATLDTSVSINLTNVQNTGRYYLLVYKDTLSAINLTITHSGSSIRYSSGTNSSSLEFGVSPQKGYFLVSFNRVGTQLFVDSASAVKSKTEVIYDTTPQLGGDLDVNGNAIDMPSGGFDDFLDEDDMSSDSATAVPSQQSVKAYVDSIGGTDALFKGSLVLGTNPSAIDMEGKPFFIGRSTSVNTNLTIAISNAPTTGAYGTWGAEVILYLLKTVDTDITVSFTYPGATMKYLGGAPGATSLTLSTPSGETNAYFLIRARAMSGVVFVDQNPYRYDVLDEDDLVSDSATKLATQQSIKAYVDNNIPSAGIALSGTSTLTGAVIIDTSSSGYDVTFRDPSAANESDFIIGTVGNHFRTLTALVDTGVLFRDSSNNVMIDIEPSSKIITIGDQYNFVINTTTGTKIGTAATQKIGLWNATPIVQPTTGISAATFSANTSGIADDTATFDGYTIGQIVKALRNIGALE